MKCKQHYPPLVFNPSSLVVGNWLVDVYLLRITSCIMVHWVQTKAQHTKQYKPKFIKSVLHRDFDVKPRNLEIAKVNVIMEKYSWIIRLIQMHWLIRLNPHLHTLVPFCFRAKPLSPALEAFVDFYFLKGPTVWPLILYIALLLIHHHFLIKPNKKL